MTSADKAAVLGQWADLLQRAEIMRRVKINADRIAQTICHSQPQYYEVMMRCGMPWQLVGAIHHLKDGGSFELHLGGDTPIEKICNWNTEAIFSGTWAKCAADYLALRGFAMGRQDWRDALGWLWEAARIQVGDGMEFPYLWAGTAYCLSREECPDAYAFEIGLVVILASLGVIRIGETPAQSLQVGDRVTMADPYQVRAADIGTVEAFTALGVQIKWDNKSQTATLEELPPSLRTYEVTDLKLVTTTHLQYRSS